MANIFILLNSLSGFFFLIALFFIGCKPERSDVPATTFPTLVIDGLKPSYMSGDSINAKIYLTDSSFFRIEDGNRRFRIHPLYKIYNKDDTIVERSSDTLFVRRLIHPDDLGHIRASILFPGKGPMEEIIVKHTFTYTVTK